MSKKILIIEDEESIADLEKDYLELSDFEVAVANDGEIGRRKALEEDYDLIILGSDAAGRGWIRDLPPGARPEEHADHYGVGEKGRH